MKIHTILLIIILIFAFLVRVVGTNPGHWEYHPDEPTSYDTAIKMIINHDINPRRFDYPAGLPIIHMIVFQSFFIPMGIIGLFIEKPDVVIAGFLDFQNFPGNISEDLFGYRAIIALFWSRYITAVLGTLSVIALYMFCNVLFGEKLRLFSETKQSHSFLKTALEGSPFSRIVGLIAAFFLAFNYLSVLRSHYGLPDIPNALFTILALITIVQLMKKDSPRNYYITALVIGLVFAVKFQALVLIPFAFVHILWAIRKKSFSYLFRKEVFLSGIIIIIVFLALNPYLPFHLKPVPVNIRIESFITSNEVTAKRYGFGSNVFNPFPLFFLYKWGIGKAVTLSVLSGAVLMLVASPPRFIFLMSIIAPFMYVFMYYGGAGAGYYVRNYATILPLLLIFAAFLYAKALQQLFKLKLLPKFVAIGLIIVLLFVVSWDQIIRSSTLSYYWSKPWLHIATAQWAGKYLPKDAQIEESSGLVQGHMRQYGEFTNLITWGRDSAYSVTSLAEMEEEDSDFILLVSNQIHHQTISWMNPLTFSELLAYDDVPYERLDNTYLGLSVYQMFDYTVYSAYKPIAYPNQFYIISKIPKTDTKIVQNIHSFEFDKPETLWTKAELPTAKDNTRLKWDYKEGYQKKGSLRLQSVSNSITRFSSPILPVKEGKVYQVVGRIKNTKKVPKTERSIFLRVDLYANKESVHSLHRGIHVAVSPRAWGDTKWQELKATTIKIPKDINVMQVSIQAHGDKESHAYLDSVTISEIEQKEIYSNILIKPVRIPSDYIYPKAIL